MCTPSRSVLMTGLQTPDNRHVRQHRRGVGEEPVDGVPTIGHMLRKAGYYTAYKGKWHLNKDFDTHEPDQLFTKEMDAYGFSDYVSPGDLIGHTLGGYEFDHLIAGSAITWLRRVGRPLSNDGQAVEPVRQPREPARHHVLQHRRSRAEGPGHGQTAEASGPRARSRALSRDVGSCPWPPTPARGRWTRRAVRAAHGEFLKVWDSRARPHSRSRKSGGGGSTTSTSTRMRTMDLQIAAAPERARRARPHRSDHRRLHLRSRRDGGRARPSRQRPVRLRGEHSHPAR